MDLLPLVLVLSSALLHAVWNAMLKHEARPDRAALGVTAIAGLSSSSVALFVPGVAFADPRALGWGIAAGVTEGLYVMTLSLAFRHATLAVAYPIARGSAILAVWPISVAWLGEPATPTALTGAVLVAAGLGALAFEGRQQGDGRGVAWALACAVSIAAYHLCYKQALGYHAEPAALAGVSLLGSLPVLAGLLGRRGVREAWEVMRARPRRIGSAGVLCAASFLVFLFALRGAGAGAIVTLRNTSVLFALGLAYLLGERPRRGAIAGVVLVASGAVLVGWPAR